LPSKPCSSFPPLRCDLNPPGACCSLTTPCHSPLLVLSGIFPSPSAAEACSRLCNKEQVPVLLHPPVAGPHPLHLPCEDPTQSKFSTHAGVVWIAEAKSETAHMNRYPDHIATLATAKTEAILGGRGPCPMPRFDHGFSRFDQPDSTQKQPSS